MSHARHTPSLFALVAIGSLSATAALGQDVLLTGTVTAAGQKLEGIVVSAQMANSSIVTSVYTDDRGEYFLPKLGGGSYRVWAQAGGYAGGRATVQLSGS